MAGLRRERAAELVAVLDAEVNAVATTDPRRAASAALDGVTILVNPPRLTFDLLPPAATAEWQLIVTTAHPDPEEAWDRLDEALSELHDSIPGLDSAAPVEWASPTGGPAFLAYDVRYTEAVG